ncbi:P-loop containing nucleoside triphosphate hydrolase protein [Hysterangium stoloniferum]|nr:P-loop containing nucleoside triphosphate hydrolase protein [Hysterangium stoloniferum]
MTDSQSSESEDYQQPDPVPSSPVLPLGLLDPILSEERRRQLNVINKLHSLDANLGIDIPQIVVVGSQSAGKSSLIESISGITLPRSSGTCTRCPTECKLIHSPKRWQCAVSVRIVTDGAGEPLPEVRNIPFGDPMTDPAKVEERIRRAQRAALNPDKDYRAFLDGEASPGNALDFTKNCVSLDISGPDITDLSFCDLPGLIASVSDGGREEDIEKVKQLVSFYISKPSCVILLTVACEVDFETQGAYRLAKEHDKQGTRTIGVLTKPDRIPEGETNKWLKMIKGEQSALEHGWYCVKQPSTKEMEQNLTFQAARRIGEDFFREPPWSTLASEHRRHLGTLALTQKLNEHLMDLISKRFPALLEELKAILEATREELSILPKPTSNDPVMELMHLISDFSHAVFNHAEGFLYYTTGLVSDTTTDNQFESIRRAHEGFRYVNCPFTPKVVERVRRATTRELSGYFPFKVIQDLVSFSTMKWEKPSLGLVDTYTILSFSTILLSSIITLGGIQAEGFTVLYFQEYMQQRRDEAVKRVKWALELESNPFTLNQHYFDDYRQKFLNVYKAKRGHHLYNPWDPDQYGIEIMATVRAYFQVAYKRVVDNIPLNIDRELVRVSERNLREAVTLGLKITGDDVRERCEALLAEPVKLTKKRHELQHRLEMLAEIQAELESAV